MIKNRIKWNSRVFVMSENLEKAVLAICGTVFVLVFAVLKFGGFCLMRKNCCFGFIAGSALLFVVSVFLYLIYNGIKDNECFEENHCHYSKLYKTAAEWNKVYWVDSSNISVPVPKGKNYFYVKDDVEFASIEFESANVIEEIYFLVPTIAI